MYFEKFKKCLYYFTVIFVVFTSLVNSSLGFASLESKSFSNYILFILSIVIIFIELRERNFKFYTQKPIDIAIICFLFFFFITVMINDNKISNFKTLYFTAFQMLFLFHMSISYKKEMLYVLKLYVYLVTVLNIVSFLIILFNIDYGIIETRACGMFSGPNMGSFVVCTSVILSLIFLFKENNKVNKIMYVLNIIFGGFMLIFLESRAGIITFACFCSFMVFVLVSKRKNIFKGLFLALLVIILIIVSPKYINKGIKYALYSFDKITTVKADFDSFATNEINKEETNEPQGEVSRPEGRPEGNALASTKSRVILICYGLKIGINNPIFGVGQYNVPNHLGELNGGIVENSMITGGTHNTYVQVFAANGLTGIITYLIIIFLLFCNCYKFIKGILMTKKMNLNDVFDAGLISMFFSLSVYGMFEMLLIMNAEIIAVIYWILAGLINTLRVEDVERNV